MKIKEISIKNFRGIEDLTLQLNDFTVLIGKNGVGKSSILHALNFFKKQKYSLKIEDYYRRDLSRKIEVSLTFIELSEEEKEEFKAYIQGEELKVIKIAEGDEVDNIPSISQSLHGIKLSHERFEIVRRATNAIDKKKSYNELREDSKYESMQSVRKADDIEPQLIAWETINPGELILIRDNGKFFGWPGVGIGKLGKSMEFFFIPAVHEYSREESEKSTYLKEILDLTIRRKIIHIPELDELKENTQTKYHQFIEEQNQSMVSELSGELTLLLETLSPGCKFAIDFHPGDVIFSVTDYSVELEEYGFKGPISTLGHGVQRTSFFTLLRYLGEQQIKSKIESTIEEGETESTTSNKFLILFIIEEPELYQHPNRIRLIKKIFKGLTVKSDDSTFQFQIICSSHSPYLIDIQDAEDIKLIRKIKNYGNYDVNISNILLDKIAKKIKILHQLPDSIIYNAKSLKSRLKAIMTLELSEGYFADKVVLVEGLEDKAVIQAIDQYSKNLFDSKGIVVIPVIGKNNLDRPSLIFQDLGIPVYLIFDTDSDKPSEIDNNEKINTILMEIMGETAISNPMEMKIQNKFASIDPNMTDLIKNAIGDELYTQIMDELKIKYEFQKDKDCKKNYIVMTDFIKKVYNAGKSIPELDDIIEKIYNL